MKNQTYNGLNAEDGMRTARKHAGRKRTVMTLLFVCMALLLCVNNSTRSAEAKMVSSKKTKGGMESSNILNIRNDEERTQRRSYLYHDSDGTYNRLERVGRYLYSEIYNAKFELQSKLKVKMELPIWGGVYRNSEHYYVLLGDVNHEKKKGNIEFRIIKYDKNWNELASRDISDSDSQVPLYSGSSSFQEMNGDLYIRTNHLTYDDKQGSVMMRIRMSDLQPLAVQANIAGQTCGCVGNPCGQFMAEKDGKIYACDYGESNPRGIAVMKFNEDITENNFFGNHFVSYGTPFRFYGKPGTYFQEAYLGGFAVSDTHLISVGGSLRQTKSGVKKTQRNIFVTTVRDVSPIAEDAQKRNTAEQQKYKYGAEFDNGKSEFTWITNYSGDSVRGTEGAKIVPLQNGTYMLLWAESYEEQYNCTKYVFLDKSGKEISKVISVYAPMSDCQPILCGENVVWYTTDESSPVFYSIPAKLPKLSPAKKGKKFTYAGVKYKVIKAKKNKREVCAVGYKELLEGNTIVLPDYVYYGGLEYKVTSVANRAFKNCRKLGVLSIGPYVKEIGKEAFYGCRNLESIYLKYSGYTTKSIGKNAFKKSGTKSGFVEVPKKKKSKYKKLLRKRGLNKRCAVLS